MLFAITCIDRSGALDLRMATRPLHLAFLQEQIAKLTYVGALLEDDGKQCGSLLVVDVADRAEAEAFMAADPNTKAGIFQNTTIQPFRLAYRDGERVG